LNKMKCFTTLTITIKILHSAYGGEGKTTYTFSVSVNAFSVEFPLSCYQQAGRVWYVSGELRRTYTLFYPAPAYSTWRSICYMPSVIMLNVVMSNVVAREYDSR
jgi:hypothetical protein